MKNHSATRSFSSKVFMLFATSLTLLGGSCSSLTQNSLTIDPQAHQALRAMSDTLASAQQFSFHTSRSIDAALVLGTNINESAQVDLFVSRPNKLKSFMATNRGQRHLLYDGNKVITYSLKRNEYASQDAPATIDGVIDSVSGDWGVRPPLSDILVSDPYHSLTHEGGSVNHAGVDVIGGITCDHLSASQPNTNWDLWIGQKDHLPRKLVITIKARDGSPKISSLVSNWNLSPRFPADLFTIQIPENASQTNLIRTH